MLAYWKFESISLHRRVACELDITGSAIEVRSKLKLAAFIDDSENDVLSYLDFASAIVSAPRCRMHLHGLPVEAKAAGAEGNDVEEPAGHHQVLVEVYHIALISGRQMHAKSGAQAHKGK